MIRRYFYLFCLLGFIACNKEQELSSCDPQLPTAFSPNGDFVNDTYKLINPDDIQEFILLVIVDRKGNVIFTSSDPEVGWDGMDNGIVHNNEVYIATLEYVCDDVTYKISQGITIFI